MNPTLSLAIHHNILLTSNERQLLQGETTVKVVGVSVPVWCLGDKHSEPAKEVFCNYYLKNSNIETPVQRLADGYAIFIPNKQGKAPPALTDDEWRKLTEKEKEDYYTLWVPQISTKNLLDVKNGGCGCLKYREQNKIKFQNKIIKIMHYIHINPIEVLTVFKS